MGADTLRERAGAQLSSAQRLRSLLCIESQRNGRTARSMSCCTQAASAMYGRKWMRCGHMRSCDVHDCPSCLEQHSGCRCAICMIATVDAGRLGTCICGVYEMGVFRSLAAAGERGLGAQRGPPHPLLYQPCEKAREPSPYNISTRLSDNSNIGGTLGLMHVGTLRPHPCACPIMAPHDMREQYRNTLLRGCPAHGRL